MLVSLYCDSHFVGCCFVGTILTRAIVEAVAQRVTVFVASSVDTVSTVGARIERQLRVRIPAPRGSLLETSDSLFFDLSHFCLIG